MEQIIIAGAGCAGLTAAIYAARAELEPLVLAGDTPGGQLSETTSVENFPGFPDGILGPDIMERFQQQAERFGARVLHTSVTAAELQHDGPQKLTLSDGSVVETCALIVATGARPKLLGLLSEEKLKNKGVSYCATCDGALYRKVPVAVVGGGDSALEEALFLSRFASTVYIVHRRNTLRGSKIMQERALANDKIEFVWDSIVEEILDVSKDEVTGIRVKDLNTGKETIIECSAVFPAIGHVPNTEPFRGQLKLDERGYIMLPDGNRSITHIGGVFVAGDCADSIYRQAITAAGMGCRAAIDAERWLEAHECALKAAAQ